MDTSVYLTPPQAEMATIYFALQGERWIDNRQGHELLSWLSLQAKRQGGVELDL